MKKEILEKMLNSKKNLIVSGDISTGKTLNVLFPLVKEIIDRKESLLILDSKEEYINKYYEDLKSKNYNIVILNLRDLSKSEGWNPLEYPYNLYKNGNIDDAIDYLEKLAKIMFYENSSVDPFWSFTASDFYTGIVLGLFEDAKEDEINLNSVNLIIDETNKKLGLSDYVTQYFKMKNPNSQPYVFASTTFLAPKETKGSILSVARQKLRPYVSREMLSVLLSKTTFNYDDVISKPTAIFVIAKDENKYINNVATMFIEQLFTILINSQNHNKFNFVLDNIDVLDKIQELSEMLSSGISRDIKFEIATRSYDDLNEKYGNYITKLSDSVVVGKEIKLLINNEEYTDEVEYLILPIANVLIQYPILKKTDIKLFNLEKFVNSDIGDLDNLELNTNIDNLVNEIDKKIAQLETNEKIDNMMDPKIVEKEDLSFEQLVKSEVIDPFFVKLIVDYFKNEIGRGDAVSKKVFKDLLKYDDIFNEFTKYLVQKNYDIPNAINVEGYTAKQIAELNPKFKATGVYTFLNYLRENPEEAKEVIRNNFPNKDVIPLTMNNNYYIKLVHIPFHKSYGTRKEMENESVQPIITYFKVEINKPLFMDKIKVIVNEVNSDGIKLTAPYQDGIIGDYNKYQNKLSNEFFLKINDTFKFYLDVRDALESWEITLIKQNKEVKI